MRTSGVAIVVVLGVSSVFMLSRSPWQATPGPRFELHPIANCYGVLADRLSTWLDPDDLAASEAIGLFGWVLQDTKIHDPLGLVDRQHARHGEYHGQWGKTDYRHLHDVRPAVLVLHEGSVVTPRAIERGTNGAWKRDYAGFFVRDAKACGPYRLIVYVAKGRRESLLQAVDGLEIRPLPSP